MTNSSFEVVIAGAGPSGVAAAIILHQAGLQVALIDDVSDQQWKVGESLPGATKRLLHRLGIPNMETLLSHDDFHPCVANASSWGKEEWEYKDALFNPEGGGWHIHRHRFDAALRARAIALGISFFPAKIDGIQALSEDTTKPLFQLSFKKPTASLPDHLKTQWVIDATGRRSAISRQFKASRSRVDDQMAVYTWLQTPAEDVDQSTRLKSVRKGWWYSSPLPGQKRILAFHALPKTVAKMIRQPSLFIAACNATDLLPYAISEDHFLQNLHATDAGISQLQEVGAAGWLAVGDAVLSFDPLSSQGIFFALYSGIRGAEILLKILQTPEKQVELFDAYKESVQKVFMANHHSRKYYYQAELRYAQEAFWQERR